jgi:hypothetical protein
MNKTHHQKGKGILGTTHKNEARIGNIGNPILWEKNKMVNMKELNVS